jgi:Na+/H+-dicarboxylate symporter
MMRTMTNVTGQILVPVIVAKEERILDQTVYDGAVETHTPAGQAVLVAAE